MSIVDVDLPAALDRYGKVADAPLAVPVRLGARRSSGEPNASDVAAAARFEPVLQELVARHRLDAITLRCFDHATGWPRSRSNHLVVIAGHHAERARRSWNIMLVPAAPPSEAR